LVVADREAGELSFGLRDFATEALLFFLEQVDRDSIGERGTIDAALPVVGAIALAGAALLWATFLALGAVNLIILLMIGVFYIVVTIFIVSLFFAFLLGLVTG